MTKINEYSKEERELRTRIKALADEIRGMCDVDPELTMLASTINDTKRVASITDGNRLNLAPAYMISETFWLFVESRPADIQQKIIADRVGALKLLAALYERLRSDLRAEAGEFQGHA